jgi:hypothetical protein
VFAFMHTAAAHIRRGMALVAREVEDTTIAGAAARAIARGEAVIVVAAKTDNDMCRDLARAARRVGRVFYEVTLGTPGGYQVPWNRLDAGQIAAMLQPDFITEPHYQHVVKSHIVQAVRVLRAANIELNLQELVRYLDPAKLGAVVHALPASAGRQEAKAHLDSFSKREQGDIAGLLARLSIVADSEIAPWFSTPAPASERLDLLEAVADKAVVYFNLECHDCPFFAPIVGAAVGIDLLTTADSLLGSTTPSLVSIDRFSEISTDQQRQLLQRSCSAGMGLILGTQELDDAL